MRSVLYGILVIILISVNMYLMRGELPMHHRRPGIDYVTRHCATDQADGADQ